MANQELGKGMERRDFLKAGGVGALALTLASAGIPADLFGSKAYAAANMEMKLQFKPDGKFKIAQFNDTQDDENIDRRTIELMEKVFDDEKPDFVVLNGDNITGGCDTPEEMKQAINNIAQPMEKREIKWA
ncbi:twin-arginine translocation signal domain-containing protein [Bacillus sp. REN3]|uniref:twin-arginine translocation signal domain-containing protein n=1 Tax=Bacillus sp. REN3 TaxID=2802440 RepID=UPI001AED9BD1|nr:twin-arginine translocation signal domain-containing protein [Bacillus sp. REN3]